MFTPMASLPPQPHSRVPLASHLKGRVEATAYIEVSLMFESDVVEIDGVFVGAAILQANRTDRAFFATHDRLRPMHGAVLPSMAAIRYQAARHFRGVSSTAETIAGSRQG